MTITQRLDDGIYVIDLNFQGMAGVIAAYLVQDGDDRALIEVGPESTMPMLLARLEHLGVEPETIGSLLVTHIHLDHAGAAGNWIQRFPGTHLLVHERGAPHMIDPSKLLVSATRIYGDQMRPLWGDFLPVPSARVTALTDGDVIPIGGRRLEVLYTPGHASHHVAFSDPADGSLFTGDVAAIRLQGFEYVRPATPPPDISLEQWNESLDKLESVNATTLYLTHFGPFTDAAMHLDQTRRRLADWAGVVHTGLEQGAGADEIKRQLRLHADRELGTDADPTAVRRYELATPTGMSANGMIRYYTKQAQRASTSAQHPS